MIQEFSTVVNAAPTGKKASIRALQAWQYLIGKAYNRQTIRYPDLAGLMEYKDNRPLTPILGHIMFFCAENNLPPLTILVVNVDGTPGAGFTDADPDDFHRERERVFNFDWCGLVPPTIEEFKQAWKNAKQASSKSSGRLRAAAADFRR